MEVFLLSEIGLHPVADSGGGGGRRGGERLPPMLEKTINRPLFENSRGEQCNLSK